MVRWRIALLLHKRFGWDFVLYRPLFRRWILRRVYTLPNGRKFVRWNGHFDFFDEMLDIKKDVKPLTFSWDQKEPAQLRVVW